ncbi:MAG: hypothetical protein ACXWDL_10830 [Nocardioides sp.]
MKVLLVVVVLAAVIYLAVRVIQRRGRIRRPHRQRPEPRITGPDDDPDFLRGLDRPDDDQ